MSRSSCMDYIADLFCSLDYFNLVSSHVRIFCNFPIYYLPFHIRLYRVQNNLGISLILKIFLYTRSNYFSFRVSVRLVNNKSSFKSWFTIRPFKPINILIRIIFFKEKNMLFVCFIGSNLPFFNESTFIELRFFFFNFIESSIRNNSRCFTGSTFRRDFVYDILNCFFFLIFGFFCFVGLVLNFRR